LMSELITRPEESYRLWCVVMCDLETSWMRRSWHTVGCCAKNNQTDKQTNLQINTTHEITQQISCKLLRMDVLTSETGWALNKEIIKQVTSSWSLFIQLSRWCTVQ